MSQDVMATPQLSPIGTMQGDATTTQDSIEGICLINKPTGCTSFDLVAKLRRILNVRKIGHAGTLDPFATGVMVMLIGRNYTRLSDRFLEKDKQYLATLRLGVATDSYDCDGTVTAESTHVPLLAEVEEAIAAFQGTLSQIPPMHSAKKVKGQPLYKLARQGIVIDRAPVSVTVRIELLDYTYPTIQLRVVSSKGTYIRSLAHDIGEKLTSLAHLTALHRERSGTFHSDSCFNGARLMSAAPDPTLKDDLLNHLITNNL